VAATPAAGDGCRPESRLGEECPVGDGSAAAILQWTDAATSGAPPRTIDRACGCG